LAALHRIGVTVSHSSSSYTHSQRRVARYLRGRPSAILIHGGGNFGDLYDHHHELRLSIMCDFPREKIVQLPQTVDFQSEKSLARTIGIMSACDDLTVLVRDEVSLATLSGYAIDVRLAPDPAHLLRPIASAPRGRFTYIARTDGEALVSVKGSDPTDSRDWAVEGRRPLLRQLAHCALANFPAPSAITTLGSSRAMHRNEERLRGGVRVLSTGEAIVTDRLHAALLGMQIDRRVFATDNVTGKLGRYFHTWNIGADQVTMRPTLAEALESALGAPK
jgi:pyruvyl transferase EpsO